MRLFRWLWGLGSTWKKPVMDETPPRRVVPQQSTIMHHLELVRYLSEMLHPDRRDTLEEALRERR